MEQGNEKVARSFGTLAVVAVGIVHAPTIAKKTGLGKK
jgi:hypothetical protein